MTSKQRIAGLAAVMALVTAVSARADWKLTDESSVSYISIKNHSVAETNRFSDVTGRIDANGLANVTINLASVDTQVEIRNERMREIFFEVAQYPKATISLQLEPVDLAQIDAGAVLQRVFPLTVSLHGAESTVDAHLRATKVSSHLLVSTVEPILITADDFGLEAGVAALQEVAGLQAISRAIPVTVDLKLQAK